MTSVSLDVVPAFVLRQYVFEQLPWSTVEADLDAILESAYSVSLFTMWEEAAIGQVWVKTTEQLSPGSSYFGAAPATQPRHPIPGANWENCTEQLGVPGPSGERLPHFRLGFTPSGGDELQSEYVVAREHGVDAIRELRRLSRSRVPAPADLGDPDRCHRHALAQPVLRAGQHRVSLHLEAACSTTFSPSCRRSRARSSRSASRPHWGKLFTRSAEDLEAVYPKLPDVSAASADVRRRRQVPQRVHRALHRLKQPLRRERRPSGPGAARPVPPRHGRARRSSRRRRARARSRTARSSP